MAKKRLNQDFEYHSNRSLFEDEFTPKLCQVAAAMIGTAVVGAAVSSSAASSAAHKQEDAANAATAAQTTAGQSANALNWAQYQQTLRNNQPYLQGGQTAYSAMLGGLGLGSPTGNVPITGTSRTTSTGNTGPAPSNPYVNGAPANTPTMTTQPVTPGMSSALAVPAGSPGATSDGVRQPLLAGPGPAVMGGANPGVTVGNGTTSAPGASTTAGTTNTVPGVGDVSTRNLGASTGQMDQAASAYSGQFDPFGFKPDSTTIDPSYAWRLAQGQKILENSAAARGGLLTGQAVTDQTNYAQNAASQEYAAANARYQANQNTLWNRLASLSGTGQVAGQSDSTAGTTAGQVIGNTTTNTANTASGYATSGANAAAAGAVAGGNAWNSAINTGVGNAAGWNYLNNGSSSSSVNNGNIARGGDVSWGGNTVTSGGQTYTEG